MRAAAKLTQAWADRNAFTPLRAIAVGPVHALLAEPDRTYFRESREKMLGMSLEQVSAPDAIAAANKELGRVLAPVEAVLADHPFLGGDAPYYGDYIVFGTLMWPHTVTSDFALDAKLRTAAWFERMLDLHDGYARGARRGPPFVSTSGGGTRP